MALLRCRGASAWKIAKTRVLFWDGKTREKMRVSESQRSTRRKQAQAPFKKSENSGNKSPYPLLTFVFIMLYLSVENDYLLAFGKEPPTGAPLAAGGKEVVLGEYGECNRCAPSSKHSHNYRRM